MKLLSPSPGRPGLLAHPAAPRLFRSTTPQHTPQSIYRSRAPHPPPGRVGDGTRTRLSSPIADVALRPRVVGGQALGQAVWNMSQLGAVAFVVELDDALAFAR